MTPIDQDFRRFRELVKGKIKEELRRYVTQGELIGRRGKEYVSIPLPRIEIPQLRYGRTGGVGSGAGEEGTPIALAPGEGRERGEAGSEAGDHILEVDISLDELAEILGEQLGLPRIEPRGKQSIRSVKERYTGVHTAGPESLRHFKRTYRRALLRQMASGTYDPQNPLVIPVNEDKRYRSWKSQQLPEVAAVILYCMDVSGSMGPEEKEIVRITSFWIDTWLRSQYPGLESRYIIHDAEAREVDEETFYRTRESGGTRISSAYRLADTLIDKHYSPEQWNIYLFHFSDGDNWTGDSAECMRLLAESLLPKANLFCYGQVRASHWGGGRFIDELSDHFEGDERVVTSEIVGKEGILNSIKEFLRTGR